MTIAMADITKVNMSKNTSKKNQEKLRVYLESKKNDVKSGREQVKGVSAKS